MIRFHTQMMMNTLPTQADKAKNHPLSSKDQLLLLAMTSASFVSMMGAYFVRN